MGMSEFYNNKSSQTANISSLGSNNHCISNECTSSISQFEHKTGCKALHVDERTIAQSMHHTSAQMFFAFFPQAVELGCTETD